MCGLVAISKEKSLRRRGVISQTRAASSLYEVLFLVSTSDKSSSAKAKSLLIRSTVSESSGSSNSLKAPRRLTRARSTGAARSVVGLCPVVRFCCISNPFFAVRVDVEG
jgi:hypothetical protein